MKDSGGFFKPTDSQNEWLICKHDASDIDRKELGLSTKDTRATSRRALLLHMSDPNERGRTEVDAPMHLRQSETSPGPFTTAYSWSVLARPSGETRSRGVVHHQQDDMWLKGFSVSFWHHRISILRILQRDVSVCVTIHTDRFFSSMCVVSIVGSWAAVGLKEARSAPESARQATGRSLLRPYTPGPMRLWTR